MEQAAKVGSTEPPPPKGEDAPTSAANSKFGWPLTIAFGVAALGAGLLVVVLRPPPDPILITNSPTVSPTAQDEFDYLVDLLEPISGDKLFLEGSAQYQAFYWLLNEDPAMLDTTATRASTLINRYVLATLYYSTNGPGWIKDYNFLSDQHVCDWNNQGGQGVDCFSNGNDPLSVRFGTC
jgi:hypothetical protein